MVLNPPLDVSLKCDGCLSITETSRDSQVTFLKNLETSKTAKTQTGHALPGCLCVLGGRSGAPVQGPGPAAPPTSYPVRRQASTTPPLPMSTSIGVDCLADAPFVCPGTVPAVLGRSVCPSSLPHTLNRTGSSRSSLSFYKNPPRGPLLSK